MANSEGIHRTQLPACVRRTALASAILLTALVAVDALSSVAFRNRETATIKEFGQPLHEGPARVVVILPGFGMSGQLAAKSLSLVAGDNTRVLGVDYAQRGVDLEQISHLVLGQLNAGSKQDVYFYGASMGGLVASHIANEYVSSTHAPATLVLDTAPYTASDIRRPGALLSISCYYPGGIISSKIWSLAARFASRVPITGADPSVVDSGRHYGEEVGTPALTSQACFIWKTKPNKTAGGDLRVLYSTAPDADLHDPLVRTRSAFTGWAGLYPDIERVAIAGRQGSWHIPLVERPLDVKQVLQRAWASTGGD